MISALRDRGYLTVGDLRTATDADLLRARGVGRGRLAQIRRYLSMTGGAE
jgi:DNA-directed RNA polymerase alpha subunit